MAHLYGIINISSVVWIDEEGIVVRAPAVEYATNMFKEFHGLDCQPHLDALRRWVKDGELPMDRAAVRAAQLRPTHDEQLARAEFSLAWWLHQQGAESAAAAHFDRAGQLSPHDWTIRRGSMPIRGQDPMLGTEFFELFQEWEAAGKPDYATLAAQRASDGS